MEKKNIVLMVILSVFLVISAFYVMDIKASETLSGNITTIRNGTITRLKDVNNASLFVDKALSKDTNGNYVYSFGLGCNTEEKCIADSSVVYSGEVTSTEYNSETITIEQAKEKWNNPNDGINPDNRWDKNGMNEGTPSFAVEAAKNSYSVLYKQMGKYNNKDIDVKLTLVDFENISIPKYTVSASAIAFTKNQIGVNVTGVKWVKIKIEFFDSETNELISVKGNTTYWDIDQNQGIIINNSDSSNKGIYYSNKGLKCIDTECTREEKVDNQLYYALIDTTDIYIFDQNSGLDNTATNNLYNDHNNSAAYAISEEFEGNTIFRTIQYSNPVMINEANETNIWTGHGGLFLSSKSIEIPRYTVTTEVVNGTIDPSVTVYEGENVTIKYSPKPKYELSEIYIDGVKIDIKDYKTEYLFSNINKDYHIKVIYIENPNTGIVSLTKLIIPILIISILSFMFIKKKQYINQI